jgi:hypothetical protein
VKGPVAGAQVCAYAVLGRTRGAGLGSCTTSDAAGGYTLTVPAAGIAVWIEANGGSFIDEATALGTTLPPGSPLRSLVTATGGNVNAMLTPLTTLAFNAALNGSGTFDIGAYRAAVAALTASFQLPSGLDIDTTVPAFGSAGNAYGEALLRISRMVLAGIPLAQLLATTQPSQLQSAYAAAAAPVNPPVPPAAGPAAPLVITGATPSTWNGTLAKATAQFEHGSSDETATSFQPTQPYCRVAAYGLVNSGDGKKYYLEIPFRKDTRAIGLLKFGDDASLTTLARVLNPATGVGIDIANRRITFTNLVIGTGAQGLTLNGSIEYPTNVAPENRAACG